MPTNSTSLCRFSIWHYHFSVPWHMKHSMHCFLVYNNQSAASNLKIILFNERVFNISIIFDVGGLAFVTRCTLSLLIQWEKNAKKEKPKTGTVTGHLCFTNIPPTVITPLFWKRQSNIKICSFFILLMAQFKWSKKRKQKKRNFITETPFPVCQQLW